MADGAATVCARPSDGRAAKGRGPRRLRRRPDFLAAARGRRFHTERITAQGRLRAPDEMREGGPAEGLYLGFTVTRRVGHATERNRIRRRLRRAVELAAADMASRAADVVVIARRPCLEAPFETLVEDLRRALDVVTVPRGPRAKPGADATRADSSGVRAGEAAHVPGPATSGDTRHGARKTHHLRRTNAPHGTTDG